jgi:hypothetical protein
MRQTRNAYRILAGSSGVKKRLEGLRCRGEDDIKVDLNEIG